MALPDIALNALHDLQPVVGPEAPQPVELDMSVDESDLDDWCWAAVSVGVARGYRNNPAKRQCELATAVLNDGSPAVTVCCAPLGDAALKFCDTTHSLAEPLKPHHRDTITKPEHRTRDFVISEINAGHPIGVRIQFTDAGDRGHFVVISGFVEGPDGLRLLVWDPDLELSEPNKVLFDEFVNHYGGLNGVWDESYVTQGADGTLAAVPKKGGAAQ